MENATPKLVAWHHQSIEDVMETLEVTSEGLSNSEITSRRGEFGRNELPKSKGRTWPQILLSQFANPLMIILVLAVTASFFLREWLDVFVIWAAILINVILGFVEEYKADRSLEKLKNYLPQLVRVRREGVIETVNTADIVPGDILLIASGDKITADARVITAQVFEVNESALTGESTPVAKLIEPVELKSATSDQTCMIFAGTIAVAGHAEAIVVGTGLNTEIGRISGLVAGIRNSRTPLQRELGLFARILSATVAILALLIFVFGIVRGIDATEMFQISVAIAVSAVPEGLVVALTIILAIGTQRILKHDALVRRLVAAETLGSVSVICVDKTGTLTTGEMSVDEVRTENIADFRLGLFLTNNAIVSQSPDGKITLSGSATEIAIKRYLEPFLEDLELEGCETVAELPFDSSRKYAAKLVRCDGRLVLFAVGAPDILLARCDISDIARRKALAELEAMAAAGQRVLMVAKKEDPGSELSDARVVDLLPAGFIGLRDPLRDDVKASIQMAREAGMRPVMVTGDHATTALAVAKEAGLIYDGHRLVTGVELDEMTDAELAQEVATIDIFARVMPEHKIRIIRAWQTRGHSVAMTGDGVNDAPALKAADIGVALGSGTEVAKETADMVLLKNSFSTIVAAIREGRIIFDNIRKVIVYLLADSLSEIILIFGSLLFALPLPVLPAQILWINLITDGFPSAALTFEPGEKGIMKDAPRKKNARIVNQEMFILIVIVSVVANALLFGLYIYLLQRNVELAQIRTFIFVALGLDSLVYVFAVRKFRTSVLSSSPFENKWLVLAVFGGLILQFMPLLIPALRELFGFVALTPVEWLAAAGIALLTLILIEGVKVVFNRRVA